MLKWDSRLKLNKTINHITLACELTFFSTYFINQIERIKEMIKRNGRRESITYKVEPWTEIRSLWEMVKSTKFETTWALYLSSRPTVLAFGSLDFEFVWKSYDQNKKKKIERKFLVFFFFKIFSLEWMRENWGDLKGRERGKKWPNQLQPH